MNYLLWLTSSSYNGFANSGNGGRCSGCSRTFHSEHMCQKLANTNHFDHMCHFNYCRSGQQQRRKKEINQENELSDMHG